MLDLKHGGWQERSLGSGDFVLSMDEKTWLQIRSRQHRSRGMEKTGNERVRTMAIEIAWNWIRLQPNSAITKWFNERYADAGPKARKCGIGGVARKLLIALWRYLEFGEIPEGAVLNG